MKTIAIGAAAVATLAVAAAPAHAVDALCVVLATSPEGKGLAAVPLDPVRGEFALTYVHSVTGTPVEEIYRAEQDGFVQTSIRFEQHGPGLPTEPDAGETWQRRDGRFVVTMARRFGGIEMRVHADQSPQLRSGDETIDLAQWGNRAVALRAARCPMAAR